MNESAEHHLADASASQLLTLVEHELAQADALHQQLQSELHTLHQASADALATAAEQRSAALSELNRIASRRIDWMTKQGLPADDSHTLHSLLAPHPQLLQHWQQLAARYRANQQVSDQLAAIVLKNRRRVQKRLQILRGQQDRSTILYTDSGERQHSAASQGFIKA